MTSIVTTTTITTTTTRRHRHRHHKNNNNKTTSTLTSTSQKQQHDNEDDHRHLFRPPPCPCADYLIEVFEVLDDQGLMLWTEGVGEGDDSAAIFHFTAFPSSLPRIQQTQHQYLKKDPATNVAPGTTNECNRHPQYLAPHTIRKRVPFDLRSLDGKIETSGSCGDDDHSHITSISSMLEDATVAMGHSGVDDGTTVTMLYHDVDEPPVDRQPSQVVSRLCVQPRDQTTDKGTDEADEHSHDDDDDHDGHSPLWTPVARTRLDFASVLMTPPADHIVQVNQGVNPMAVVNEDNITTAELMRPYDQRNFSSLASSISSWATAHYHRRHHPHSDKSTNVSEIETTFAAGLTPSRGSESADQFLPGNRSAILDLQRADEARPSNCSSEANPTGDSTPNEVRFLIQLDALQCSPIRGIPEEEGDGGSSRSQLLDHASSSKQSSRLYGLSQSQESGMSSDSASRASTRPLPDINAFEGDGVANSRDRSSDGSAAASSSVSQSTSPKLLCPPTPVRTPAWAHHEPEIVARQGQPESFGRSNHPPKLGRSNSLVTTKVLATCSPWFLEGRDNPARGENEAVDPDFLPILSSHSQYPAPFHSTELASASRKASLSMATSFDVLPSCTGPKQTAAYMP